MRDHDSGRSEPRPSCCRALPGSEVKPSQDVTAQGALCVCADRSAGCHGEELAEGGAKDQTKAGGERDRCDHPVDSAGLFSFMTFHWLTPLVVHAHRKGQLLLDDIWPVSQREGCHANSLRLAALWEEEQRSKGSEASLCSVVWSFCRTRLLLSILCLTVTQLAGFSGPAFVVKRLLEYTQQEEPELGYGLLLVVGLLGTELVRSWSLALTWALNYRTGSRLRGAVLSMAFHKILRLRSVRDKSMGQLINMCSSDGQRMFEAAAVGSLLAGGPLVAVLGVAYNLFILGPTSLLGSAVFILFYPTMMFSSRLTAYFRRKGAAVTDRRVQKMNEILNYIKFIKMYAWVKAFSQDVHRIRGEERRILELTGYFQSITVGVAPIVVVIASVATFSAHMLLGYDLTAAQAFTVVTVFNAMTFALKVTPFSVKSLSEASVAVERFKSLFLLPEVDSIRALPGDPQVAVEMCGVSLAWDGGGHSAQPSPCVRTASRHQHREQCRRQSLESRGRRRGRRWGGGGFTSPPDHPLCLTAASEHPAQHQPEHPAGAAGRCLWERWQWQNLSDLRHLRTDDCVGGQRGCQRKAGLRGSAGLDPEHNTERQHPVWTGVPGGQVSVGAERLLSQTRPCPAAQR